MGIDILFCPSCGGNLREQHVEAEHRDRLVCERCAEIHYVNPTLVAGTIPVVDGKVWLLKRGIEPRRGAWTFPAGYMEMGETVEEAAIRETREELNLEIHLGRLLNLYSRPTMKTVHAIYLAEAVSEPSCGEETLDFGLYSPEDIPWDQLAFWSTRQALEEWVGLRVSHEPRAVSG